MRTTIAAFVALALAIALCARLARTLAEAVYDDVSIEPDEPTTARSCASTSHGYLPNENDVLSGRIV
jgi:hypothetical protein